MYKLNIKKANEMKERLLYYSPYIPIIGFLVVTLTYWFDSPKNVANQTDTGIWISCAITFISELVILIYISTHI